MRCMTVASHEGAGENPALRAIGAVLRRHSLPAAPLAALIEARSVDLYSDPPADARRPRRLLRRDANRRCSSWRRSSAAQRARRRRTPPGMPASPMGWRGDWRRFAVRSRARQDDRPGRPAASRRHGADEGRRAGADGFRPVGARWPTCAPSPAAADAGARCRRERAASAFLPLAVGRAACSSGSSSVGAGIARPPVEICRTSRA